MSVSEITHRLDMPASVRTIGDELAYLKKLTFVSFIEFGRGSKWFYLNKGAIKKQSSNIASIQEAFYLYSLIKNGSLLGDIY